MGKNVFGNRLKMLREADSIPQWKLAQILKIDRTTVTNYETGKRMPNVELLCKIADYFDVSVDYLLGRSSE